MENTFAHCFDASDKLKCLNFFSTGVLSSLLTNQLFTNDKKSNPMHTDIEKLKNCTPEEIDGLSSPRMLFLFKASIYQGYKRELTESEKHIQKVANLEIEFERLRRVHRYDAPSRLSCLYLADNDEDGRLMLRTMFVDSFKEPIVIEVGLYNKMVLIRVDHKWVDRYFSDPKEEYIISYWKGEQCGTEPSWEYLLEGSIQIIGKEKWEELGDIVKERYPEDYARIIEEHERQRSEYGKKQDSANGSDLG